HAPPLARGGGPLPRPPAVRPGRPGAAACRRNDSLEAGLAHPAFDAVRPWLGIARTLDGLNRLSEERNVRTENGNPVRFVPPGAKDAYYELKVFRTGEVETRPDNQHDFFNALAW